MQKTFGHVLAAHRGLGPGFDFLRIALAFSIVLAHSFLLTGNDEFFRSTPLWFAEYALVPMFFALSGFLIAGSAQRLSLKNFLLNRGLRIVPALAVDIVVCALIIGPLLTPVALSAYFSSADNHPTTIEEEETCPEQTVIGRDLIGDARLGCTIERVFVRCEKR